MKDKLYTITLVVILIIGLSLLLYPVVSDYVNGLTQTRVISEYTDAVSDINADKYKEIWEAAEAYNANLTDNVNRWFFSSDEYQNYRNQLNVSVSGAISYIEIPKINCKLPIFHGSGSRVLQNAVGHIEGSSLPVGGETTHCVLSGHRGLPSAELFSRLDEMEIGDQFYIQTLDRTLIYEVDQILVVLPDELEALNIEEGKDYCTLVTCTPYGINSHRLLVRGSRVQSQVSLDENMPTTTEVTTESSSHRSFIPVAVFVVLIMVILFVIAVCIFLCKRRGKYEKRF